MSVRLILAGLLLLPAAVPAAVEVTPLVGYREGSFEINTGVVCVQPPCPSFAESEGSPLYGATLDVPLYDSLQFELLVNRQSTELTFRDSLSSPRNSLAAIDLDVTHLHAGLLYGWELDRVEPFITGGFGRTWIDSKFGLIRDIDLERWSGSLGGGVRMPFKGSDRYALRIEARGYWVDLPSERVNQEFIALDDQLTQLETSVGFSVKF